MRTNGFTLIELVTVIVVIAILAAIAAPKFLNFSTSAHTEALTQIKVSVKTANDFLFMKSKVPSYSVKNPVEGRADLTDIDIDLDGDFDAIGDDKIDVRLVNNYLDNTDIIKQIHLSDDFTEERDTLKYTYIGYDFNGDGSVKDDHCYFRYTQSASAGEPPGYDLIIDQC